MAPIASKSSVFQWLAFYGTFTNNSSHIRVWPTLESKVSIHLLLLFCHRLNCVPEEAQVPTRFSLVKIFSLYHLQIQCLLWFISSSFKIQTTRAENKHSRHFAYGVRIFNMLSDFSCSEEDKGMMGGWERERARQMALLDMECLGGGWPLWLWLAQVWAHWLAHK